MNTYIGWLARPPRRDTPMTGPVFFCFSLCFFFFLNNLSGCTPVEHEPTLKVNGALSSFALGEEVVVVDAANQRLLWLDLDGQEIAAQHLEGDFALIRQSHDGSKIFISHRDEEAVDVISGPTQTVRYILGSPYSAFSESPDGKHLVFFHLGNTTGGFVSNTGEISVVDLSVDPSESNPNRRTIHASQSGPQGISFGIGIEVDGTTMYPALVHLSGRLALISLNQPELAETLIPLSANPDVDGATVRSLIFEDQVRQDGALVAHSIVSDSSDLLSFSLIPDLNQPAGRLPISVQINAYGLSGSPLLVHSFSTSDGAPKALVASLIPSRLHLIDLETGLTSSTDLSGVPVSLQISEESGQDYTGSSIIIRSSKRDLFILNEDDLITQGFQALRTVRMASEVQHILPCPGFGLLFVSYKDFPGAAFVDLNRSDQIFPLGLGASVQDLTLDPTTGSLTLLDRASPANLIRLTLNDLHPEGLALPFRAKKLLFLPEAQKLAVHADPNEHPEGTISFLDIALAEDALEEALTFTGIIYHDLLDPREVQE